MDKTKAELEKEIADSRNQIDTLKSELEKANRVKDKNKSATELYERYQSYITAGFSDEQAWELTKILINNATAKRGLLG